MRRLMLNKIQAEVANALGVTFQQLQKYENGANRISASRLQLLCMVLKVPVSFFFEGLPDVPETDGDSAALNGFLATSDGIALMTGYARIRDPKVRRAIVALVEQIVAEPVSEPVGTVHQRRPPNETACRSCDVVRIAVCRVRGRYGRTAAGDGGLRWSGLLGA